jgi:hypothetical protein
LTEKKIGAVEQMAVRDDFVKFFPALFSEIKWLKNLASELNDPSVIRCR